MGIAARRLMRSDTVDDSLPPLGLSLAASGVWGAGFQNAGDKADATIHTSLQGGLVTGADVAGAHVSENYGDDWTTCNRKLINANDTRVVAIRWSRRTQNVLYMYTSPTTGYSGSLFKGTYDSATNTVDWLKVGSIGRGAYAGNETPPGEGSGAEGDGDGPNHPRQTGRKMMLLDEENGYIYLGTINGIYRYDIASRIVTQWQLSDKWITSLCFEPNSAMTMYATADGSGTTSGINGAIGTGGVWKITGVRTTPTVYQATGATTVGPGTFPQACIAVEVASGITKLYVATGAGKIVCWNGDGDFASGTYWSDVTNNLNADSASLTAVRWSGIDAAIDGSNITLLATDSCNANGRTGKTVAWSTNGGASWTKRIAIDTNVNGLASEGEWWFARSAYNNNSMLIGGSIFDSVNPIIDPNNTSRWYIMGRAGIWRTKNKGASWHPIVKGTGVTMGHAVACLPHDPDKAMAGDTDWSSFFSSDGFLTQPGVCKKLGRVGWDIGPKHFVNGAAPDTTVVIGLGSRDGNPGTRGNVVVHRNPWGASASGWLSQITTDQPLPGYADPNATPRCTGSTLAKVGTKEIILAAFQDKGIYRKDGVYVNSANPGGAWQSVETTTTRGGDKDERVTFAWSPANENIVWLCDPRADSIMRSTDAGLTWNNYTPVSLTNIASSATIIADPSHPGVYYFLDYDGSVWRITAGDSASPVVTKYVTGGHSFNPVCLAVHPVSGKVAACSGAVGGPNTPTFWVAAYNSTSFIKKTVPRWQDVGRDPQRIAWGSNDKLYAALYAGYVVIQGLHSA
jgi:hypothetical protein